MAQTSTVVLLAVPVVAGGVVAWLNADGANESTERLERWAREAQPRAGSASGFRRYAISPLLWLIVKFCDWTDGFSHRGLKNGARIAAALYLVAFWLIILFSLVQLAIMLAIGALILYLAVKFLASTNDDFKRGYETSQRVIGFAGKGQRVHPETGVIQEEGLLGWRDTDRRIDPETGVIQEEGLIGWKDTESRVEQDTGRLQHEGLIGYRDDETRIDPETGIIQKEGLIGWQDTDTRIEPGTGRRQRRGLLGWEDE